MIVVFVLTISSVFGQNIKSKGDAFYFQYDYPSAIAAYESERVENGLTATQQLNLADSYFKTNTYLKASKVYFEAYKNDSLMSNHHFNKMLQSFSKTNERDRVAALLATKSLDLGQELLENADFNQQLLQAEPENGLDFEVFNIQSNSPQSDFAPAFFKEKLLFSSGRPQVKKKNYAPMSEAYLDIYVGRVDNSGQVINPNSFDGVPESDYHKATPYYSESLNSIFYVLSNTANGELSFDENGKNALAIGMQNVGGAHRMLLRDLSTSFYYPFYDENTGKLYFAADFGDGFGGTDLYFMYTNNGQIMSAPVNLGPRINSPGNEIAPFIFENSLYFSSDVYYGLGGMDIYRSNIEEAESFSIPVNLGPVVNSPNDDFGFIMRNEGLGLLGYFSSNRNGGKGKDDIYGFKVAEKPGLKTITLRGVVNKPYDRSTGVGKASVRLKDIQGKLLKEVYSDEEGNYRIEIPWTDQLVLQAEKERHSLYTEKLEFLTGPDQQTSFNMDIGLSQYDDLVEEKEGQTVIKMNKFYFNRNQATVTAEIAKELQKVVEFAKQFPTAQLRIETHTDSRGGSSTNFRVTQARSDAIKKHLIANGVAPSSIFYSVGFGEDKILNNCKNGVFCLEMLHQQNQRSLVVVLNDNILFD